MPFEGPSPIASVSGSPSASEQLSGIVTAVSTAVRRSTSAQAGACEIAIVTVAGAETATPSEARYVNESTPAASASGV